MAKNKSKYAPVRITKAAYEHLQRLQVVECKRRGTHVAMVNLASEIILETRIQNGNGHHEKKAAEQAAPANQVSS